MQISSGTYQSNKAMPKRNTNFGNKFVKLMQKIDLPCAYCGRQMLPHYDIFEHNFKTRKGQDAVLWLQSLLPLSDTSGKKYIERFCQAFRQDDCKSLTPFELKERISTRVKKNLLPYIYTQCKVPDEPSDELKKTLNFISDTLKSDLSARRCLNAIKSRLGFTTEKDIEKNFLEQVKSIVNKLDVLRIGVVANHNLQDQMRSIEHILPRSKNGDNRPTNFLFVCPKCNCGRSNTDFKIFTEAHPEVIPNITRQLRIIDEMLPKTDEKLQEQIVEYLEGVCHTLETQFEHPMEIDLPFLKERLANNNIAKNAILPVDTCL